VADLLETSMPFGEVPGGRRPGGGGAAPTATLGETLGRLEKLGQRRGQRSRKTERVSRVNKMYEDLLNSNNGGRASPAPPKDNVNVHLLVMIHDSVGGVPPGLYVWPRSGEAGTRRPGARPQLPPALASFLTPFSPQPTAVPGLWRLVDGDFRAIAGASHCGQAEIAADGLFTVAMVAPVPTGARVTRKGGVGQYRSAHFEAGSVGQALYVAATAFSLGVTAMGCFNDDALHSMVGLPSLVVPPGDDGDDEKQPPGALQVLYTLAVGCLSPESKAAHADFPFDYDIREDRAIADDDADAADGADDAEEDDIDLAGASVVVDDAGSAFRSGNEWVDTLALALRRTRAARADGFTVVHLLGAIDKSEGAQPWADAARAAGADAKLAVVLWGPGMSPRPATVSPDGRAVVCAVPELYSTAGPSSADDDADADAGAANDDPCAALVRRAPDLIVAFRTDAYTCGWRRSLADVLVARAGVPVVLTFYQGYEADIVAKNLCGLVPRVAGVTAGTTGWFTPEALAECDSLVASLYFHDRHVPPPDGPDPARLAALRDPPARAVWAVEANPAWEGTSWFAFTGRAGGGAEHDEL